MTTATFNPAPSAIFPSIFGQSNVYGIEQPYQYPYTQFTQFPQFQQFQQFPQSSQFPQFQQFPQLQQFPQQQQFPQVPAEQLMIAAQILPSVLFAIQQNLVVAQQIAAVISRVLSQQPQYQRPSLMW